MENNDEIDLLDLAGRLVKFFKKIFWQLAIAGVLGGVGGFCFYQFMPKQYESKMLIQSEILTASLCNSMVADLNLLIKEKSWDSLANKLQIESSTASEMISVVAKSPIERAEQLKESEKNSLEISVRTFDFTKLKSIQIGIEKYLSNNPFSHQFETRKKNYYNSVIQKYDEQIGRLKMQQEQFESGKLYSAAKDASYFFDPSVFNARILNCELDKLKYQDSLKLVKRINIISGFTPFQKPVYPKFLRSVVIGIGAGIFLILLISLFKEASRLLK
jgi:hypothetical protein